HRRHGALAAMVCDRALEGALFDDIAVAVRRTAERAGITFDSAFRRGKAQLQRSCHARDQAVLVLDDSHGSPSETSKHRAGKPVMCFAPGVVARTAEGCSSLCAPDQPVTLSIEPTQEMTPFADFVNAGPRQGDF